MTQSTFPLTLFCKLISICLQSNSRLTTSKYPLIEATISAVLPVYIFFIITQIFNWKHIRKKRREFWRWKCDKIKQFQLTSPLCILTSISLQSNSRLTISKRPICEAQNSAVYPFYIFYHQQHFQFNKTYPY